MQADFTLDFPQGKEVRILQVTDTQIIDSSQCRYPTRLREEQKPVWAPENVEVRMGKYLRGAVEKTTPDYIVHTGDFSYGEFDDSGRMFDLHVQMMESFSTPWSLAFGNHERETKKGIEYLCDGLEKAKHCLFKAKNWVDGVPCEGQGNYSVLIRQGGKASAVLYILDSGMGTEELPCGIHATQRKWLKEQAKNLQGIPAYAFFHIPTFAFTQELRKYGHVENGFHPCEIPSNERGDFGYIGEWVADRLYIDWDGSLMQLLEEIGVRGVFVGHLHEHTCSLLHGKMRLTHGMKTGEYDSHHKDHLGGTLLRLSADGTGEVTVEHVFVK